MGPGGAVGLPAFTPFQFVAPQWGAGAVHRNIDPGRLGFSRGMSGTKKLFQLRTNPFGEPRELAAIHLQAGIGAKGICRALKRQLGSRPSNQSRHARSVAVDQAQCFIQRETAAAILGAVVIVAYDWDRPKQGLNDALLGADTAFARLGPVPRHAQIRQLQQPTKDIAAQLLGRVAQPVLQPGNIPQLLRLQRVGCRIYKLVELLRPLIYERVCFFFTFAPGRQTSASRCATYCSTNSMN